MYIPKHESQTDERAPVPWTNCTFASGAMHIDHWTYGAINTSDIALRNASGIPLNLGANFAALKRAILAVARLDLRYSEWDGSGNAQMTWAQLRTHLANGGGACIAGSFAKLAPYKSAAGLSLTRWQPGGDFGHCIYVCDYRESDETYWHDDPLGLGGERAPLAALWAFIFKAGTDQNARITAAHGFVGTRPPAPSTLPNDWAGKLSAFGTRYPSYVNTDREALDWVNRNIARLRADGRLRL